MICVFDLRILKLVLITISLINVLMNQQKQDLEPRESEYWARRLDIAIFDSTLHYLCSQIKSHSSLWSWK